MCIILRPFLNSTVLAESAAGRWGMVCVCVRGSAGRIPGRRCVVMGEGNAAPSHVSPVVIGQLGLPYQRQGLAKADNRVTDTHTVPFAAKLVLLAEMLRSVMLKLLCPPPLLFETICLFPARVAVFCHVITSRILSRLRVSGLQRRG